MRSDLSKGDLLAVLIRIALAQTRQSALKSKAEGQTFIFLNFYYSMFKHGVLL